MTGQVHPLFPCRQRNKRNIPAARTRITVADHDRRTDALLDMFVLNVAQIH